MNYQRETLVAYLRTYGITYLAPSDAVATETIVTESELIRSLLASGDERLPKYVALTSTHPTTRA